MASLNHVCMWTEHGWTRITAEEAAKLHPGGTVSAHSGLFMCSLCRQYVTLTDVGERVRHFRHSAYAESKDCPERTFGPLYTPTFQANEHDLPMKMVVEGKLFHLEMGFLYVPHELLEKERMQSITIKASETIRFVYSFERLNADSITYLPVGNVPYEKYEILSSEKLVSYWPKIVKGVQRKGSLFDAYTGKMLPQNSDVLIDRKYYLLTSANYNTRYYHSSIHISLLQEVGTSANKWYLYSVEATALDEDAAKFFLHFHYWLTDVPLQIGTLWPLHIEAPYIIKHSADYVIIHLRGNSENKLAAFPSALIRTQRCSENGRIARIACNGKQQLISSGRSNVLQYLYFWKGSLDQTYEAPTVSVTDLDGNEQAAGMQSGIPKCETLVIKTTYRGQAVIRKSGRIIEKRSLRSNDLCSIEGICFGTEVEILIGLDVVWSASYMVQQAENLNDITIISTLTALSGKYVAVPHQYGNLANKLVAYPRTKDWLYHAVRRGTAPEKAIKYLNKVLSEISR